MDTRDDDALYEQYVKPFEANYYGQYVGVSYQGRTIVALSLIDAVRDAASNFGKDNSIVFRVGDRFVGQVR